MTETRYIEGQGRYALAEMVGRGGFATVWRARSLKGILRGKDVAVKVIPVYSAGERSRALREGQIAEGLRHKNIVETLEVIPGDHEVYLVTEYVNGMPLDEAAKSYSVDEIVNSLTQILEALVYAHAQGIIHRDIKPQNALVDARGRVKLTDFGVAFRAGDTRLTRVGFAVGTPGYIAPEILDGADPTALTDIYAVGATARTLLAHQPYEPTPRLREFVDRATSPNPAHRPQSAWAAVKLLTGRKAPRGSVSPALREGTERLPEGLKDGALRLVNGVAAGWLGFLLAAQILDGAQAAGVAAGLGVLAYLLPRLGALGVIVALAVLLIRSEASLAFSALVPVLGGIWVMGAGSANADVRKLPLGPAIAVPLAISRSGDGHRGCPGGRRAVALRRAHAPPGGVPLGGGRGLHLDLLRPHGAQRLLLEQPTLRRATLLWGEARRLADLVRGRPPARPMPRGTCSTFPSCRFSYCSGRRWPAPSRSASGVGSGSWDSRSRWSGEDWVMRYSSPRKRLQGRSFPI